MDGGIPAVLVASNAGGKEDCVETTRADLLAQTRELWSKRYGRPITEEEAQETIDNMVAFAKIVIEWYLEDQRRDGNSEDLSDAR